MKEKIILTTQTITHDFIKIDATHTSFCHMHRTQYPDIKLLEKEVKQLRKILKNHGVKLLKTDTLKLFKEYKDKYNKMVKEYNDLFNQLIEAWRTKLSDGLYVGYRDDEYLNNIISPLQNKLREMEYRDTLLSKIKDIEINVNNIKNDGDDFTRYYSVAI